MGTVPITQRDIQQARDAQEAGSQVRHRRKLEKTARPIVQGGGEAFARARARELSDELARLLKKAELPWSTINKQASKLDRLARAMRAYKRLQELPEGYGRSYITPYREDT